RSSRTDLGPLELAGRRAVRAPAISRTKRTLRGLGAPEVTAIMARRPRASAETVTPTKSAFAQLKPHAHDTFHAQSRRGTHGNPQARSEWPFDKSHASPNEVPRTMPGFPLNNAPAVRMVLVRQFLEPGGTS